MAWNSTYWDILDGFYWSPAKLGLKSIPRAKTLPVEGGVVVPREFINPNGPLYRRVGTASTAYASLGTHEEPLNDIFDLTMAIASDRIRRALVFEPLGISDDDPIEMVGKKIGRHFGWENPEDTITQHDGFYITASSAVCVEMKLGAKSSLDQIAKYAFLYRNEEVRRSRPANLGLLFIVPERRKDDFERDYARDVIKVGAQILEMAPSATRNKRVYGDIAKHIDTYRDLFARLRIAVVSWRAVRGQLDALALAHSGGSSGDETVRRLVTGLAEQINAHDGTKCQLGKAFKHD